MLYDPEKIKIEKFSRRQKNYFFHSKSAGALEQLCISKQFRLLNFKISPGHFSS